MLTPQTEQDSRWMLPPADWLGDILRLIQIGEGVFVAVNSSPDAVEEQDEKERCRRIYIHAFRGDRSTVGVTAFKRACKENEECGGLGPSGLECLLYTGHVGICFDAKSPIYGFNPDTGSEPGWKVIKDLKERPTRPPFVGVVTDDTQVFQLAKQRQLPYSILEIVFPESQYQEIKTKFDAARAKTGLTYSFPGGAGDCNCATWPGQIGVPIPSNDGNMKAYMSSFSDGDVKKMGDCRDA